MNVEILQKDIQIDYVFCDQSSELISRELEKEMEKSFEDNLPRFLVSLSNEIECCYYKVRVIFYSNTDKDYNICVTINPKTLAKKQLKDLSMCYKEPLYKNNHTLSSFVIGYSKDEIIELIRDMYFISPQKIVVTGSLIRSFDVFNKDYRRVSASKVFRKESFIYKYEFMVDQLIKRFISSGIKNFNKRTYLYYISNYIIGEKSKIRCFFGQNPKYVLPHNSELSFFDEYNGNSINSLLLSLISEKLLPNDLIEIYNGEKDIDKLIEISKLLEY